MGLSITQFSVFPDKKLNGNAGIYAVINRHNSHCYVGQSIDLLKRKKDHFRLLSIGKHQNQYLQNAYNYYGGRASFVFVVIEFLTLGKDDLSFHEQYWIDLLNPEYNLVRDVFVAFSATFEQDRKNRTCSDDGVYTDIIPVPRYDWHESVYGGRRVGCFRAGISVNF